MKKGMGILQAVVLRRDNGFKWEKEVGGTGRSLKRRRIAVLQRPAKGLKRSKASSTAKKQPERRQLTEDEICEESER